MSGVCTKTKLIQEVRCPLCNHPVDSYSIDPVNFFFLKQLDEQGVLDEYLTICRTYLDILNQGASTTAVVTKAVSTIRAEVSRVTSDELSKSTTNITSKIQETLRGQIPDSKSVEALTKILPELTLAIHELLKKQYVPLEKGTAAEKSLRDELAGYFPEDEVIHLGGSGQTDIVIQPRVNGTALGELVIVESKSNKAWDRSYYSQIRKHMQLKQSHYAILVVETMPHGANGYLTEYFEEGTVFVTERSGCKTVYGALRAILLCEDIQTRRVSGLQSILGNRKIQQAITRAMTASNYFESIRKHSSTIITNSRSISQETDDVENLLRSCLAEMQKIIAEALATELPIETPTSHTSPSQESG